MRRNGSSVTYNWTAAPDALSGIDGCGPFTTTSAALPGATKDIEEATTHGETLADGT